MSNMAMRKSFSLFMTVRFTDNNEQIRGFIVIVGPSTGSGTLAFSVVTALRRAQGPQLFTVVEPVETPFLFDAFQPLPLEDEHIEHANGDSGISEIEDGAEEDEMVVGAEEEIRQP